MSFFLPRSVCLCVSYILWELYSGSLPWSHLSNEFHVLEAKKTTTEPAFLGNFMKLCRSTREGAKPGQDRRKNGHGQRRKDETSGTFGARSCVIAAPCSRLLLLFVCQTTIACCRPFLPLVCRRPRRRPSSRRAFKFRMMSAASGRTNRRRTRSRRSCKASRRRYRRRFTSWWYDGGVRAGRAAVRARDAAGAFG